MTAVLSTPSPPQEAGPQQPTSHTGTLGALSLRSPWLVRTADREAAPTLPVNKGLSDHDKSADPRAKCVCVERQVIRVSCTGHLLL